MKFAILRTRLLSALDIILGVVDKKPPQPALACVRISAMSNGSVQFAATNLAAGIRRTEAAIEVSRAGVIALNAHDLRERVQKATAEDVVFTLGKDATRVSIRCGSVAFSMAPFPLEEVPELATVSASDSVEVPAAMAARAIAAVAGCAYQGGDKPHQHQVRILNDDGHMMTEATDGARAVRYDSGEWDHAGPAMVLSLEGARILGDVAEKQETVAVSIGTRAAFIADGTEAYAAQFEAPFPPVEGLFSMAPTVSASVVRTDAMSWVKACLVSGGHNNRVIVAGENKQLVFRAEDINSEAVAETHVSFEWAGTAAVDGQLVLSGLQMFDSDSVMFGLSEQVFNTGGKASVFILYADNTKTKVVISGQRT